MKRRSPTWRRCRRRSQLSTSCPASCCSTQAPPLTWRLFMHISFVYFIFIRLWTLSIWHLQAVLTFNKQGWLVRMWLCHVEVSFCYLSDKWQVVCIFLSTCWNVILQQTIPDMSLPDLHLLFQNAMMSFVNNPFQMLKCHSDMSQQFVWVTQISKTS